MFELLALAFFGTLVVAGLIILGVLAMVARFVLWIVLLPFQLLGWILGGLGFLIALPFVLIGLLVGGIGLGIGALFLFAPLLPLILAIAAIVWLVRRSRRSPVTAS